MWKCHSDEERRKEKGESRKEKGERRNGERGADERLAMSFPFSDFRFPFVKSSPRMAVVAKPTTKSADSSASVN